MATDVQTQTIVKGGEWMIKERAPENIFTPEDFNEEQKMVMDMCHSFLDAEIYPCWTGSITWNPD